MLPVWAVGTKNVSYPKPIGFASRPVDRSHCLSNLLFAIHPLTQFPSSVFVNNFDLILISVVVRHAFPPKARTVSDLVCRRARTLALIRKKGGRLQTCAARKRGLRIFAVRAARQLCNIIITQSRFEPPGSGLFHLGQCDKKNHGTSDLSWQHHASSRAFTRSSPQNNRRQCWLFGCSNRPKSPPFRTRLFSPEALYLGNQLLSQKSGAEAPGSSCASAAPRRTSQLVSAACIALAETGRKLEWYTDR